NSPNTIIHNASLMNKSTVAPHFQFQGGILHAEGCSLKKLAQQYGTPLYVYSRAAINEAYQSYMQATPDRDVLVCYGMKANSNLALHQVFTRLVAGFDIVSVGELARVIAGGSDPTKIVFSGVGKPGGEIQAALDACIICFNIESIGELERTAAIAAKKNT